MLPFKQTKPFRNQRNCKFRNISDGDQGNPRGPTCGVAKTSQKEEKGFITVKEPTVRKNKPIQKHIGSQGSCKSSWTGKEHESVNLSHLSESFAVAALAELEKEERSQPMKHHVSGKDSEPPSGLNEVSSNLKQESEQPDLCRKETISQNSKDVCQVKDAHLTKTEVECSLDAWDLPESVLLQYKHKGVKSMFKWQAECLMQGNVLEGGNLVYSAPTSAGKTLVAELLVLKNVLETKKKALFILPFVSVAREKMTYLQSLFQNAGLRVDGYMGSHNPAGGLRSVDVAVCTIEKANSLINRLLEEGKLNCLGIIVVDEMHMLGDPHRGYLLELLLTKTLYMSRKKTENGDVHIQIVGMSATLPNLSLLADWLHGALYHTDFRPVPLTEYCKIGNQLLHTETMKVTKEISNALKLPGVLDQDHSIQLALETVAENHSVLVFCPSKQWCEQLALSTARSIYELGRPRSSSEAVLTPSELHLGDALREVLQEDPLLDVLEQLRRCPAGLDSNLSKCIALGVAFHHAGLTMYERDIVEGAFRQGCLKVLVATTTLSSGVNLPARRVIIRSAFMRGALMDVLSYKQMVGRAGRMGVDTQGESILICKENERNQVIKLVTSELCPVQSCLIKPGDQNLSSSLKRAVLEIVASGVASSPEDISLYASCTLLAASLDEESKHAAKENSSIEACILYLLDNEFIDLVETEKDGEPSSRYLATQLGKAVLASSLTPDEGLSILRELGKAQKCFVLENELHLVYQVTPPYLSAQMSELDWLHYLSVWRSLSESFRTVGELVGVEERFLARAVHCPPTGTSARQAESLKVHRRFYAALALHDLVQERPLAEISSKYALPKGLLQSLQQSASTFSGMVTAFCSRLGWRSLELLISQFQSRLHFGIQQELCELVTLHTVDGQRARALYNSGYETVVLLAAAQPRSVELALKNFTPFRSAKDMPFDNNATASKPVFISGYGSMTFKDASVLIVKEAKYRVQGDLGLRSVHWQQEVDPVSKEGSQPANEEHLDQLQACTKRMEMSPNNEASINQQEKRETATSALSRVNDSGTNVFSSEYIDAISYTNRGKENPNSNALPIQKQRSPKTNSEIYLTRILRCPESRLTTDNSKNSFHANNAREQTEKIDELRENSSAQDKCILQSIKNNLDESNAFEQQAQTVDQKESLCLETPVKLKEIRKPKSFDPSVSARSHEFSSVELHRTSAVRKSMLLKNKNQSSLAQSLKALDNCDSKVNQDEVFSDTLMEHLLKESFDSSVLNMTLEQDLCQKESVSDPDGNDNIVISETPTMGPTKDKSIIQLSDSIDYSTVCDNNQLNSVDPCKLLFTVKTFSRMMSCIDEKRKAGAVVTAASIVKSLKEYSENEVNRKQLAQKRNNIPEVVVSDEYNSTQKSGNCFTTKQNMVCDNHFDNTSIDYSYIARRLPESEDLFSDSDGNISLVQDKTPDRSTTSVELFASPTDDPFTPFPDKIKAKNFTEQISPKIKTFNNLPDDTPNTVMGGTSLSSKINSLDLNVATYLDSPFILTPAIAETPVLPTKSNPKQILANISNFINSPTTPDLSTETNGTSSNNHSCTCRTSSSSELSESVVLAINNMSADGNSAFNSTDSPSRIDQFCAKKNNLKPVPQNLKRKHLEKSKENCENNVLFDSPSPPKLIKDNCTLHQMSPNNEESFSGRLFTQMKTRSKKENSLPCSWESEIDSSNKAFSIIDVSANVDLFYLFEKELMSKSFVAISLAAQKKATLQHENMRRIGSSIKLGSKICASRKCSGCSSNIIVDEMLVTGISFCWEDSDAYFLSLMPAEEQGLDQGSEHGLLPPPVDKALSLEKRIKTVQAFLESCDGKQVVCFDLKHQWHLLSKGCGVSSVLETVQWLDPKIADWLLNTAEKEKTLHSLALAHSSQLLHLLTGVGKSSGVHSIGNSSGNISMGRIRAATESVLSLHITSRLFLRLKEMDIHHHFLDVEMPAVVIFCQMEQNGFGFDQALASKTQALLQKHLQHLETRACHLAGRKLSLSSYVDISKVLYRELRLVPPGFVTTGRQNNSHSTAKGVLEKLKDQHPLPAVILEWRRVSSALTKVVLPLLKECQFCPSISMHRIFGDVFLTASTGRISMREPSLLTIPKEFDISSPDQTASDINVVHDNAVVIRNLFIPFKGAVLLSADYSQLELRILAYRSQDVALLEALNSGVDVFNCIAAKWLTCAVEDISKEQRQSAKQMCYGMIYGIGKKTLAEQLNVEEHEAAKFLEDFQTAYPGIKKYMEKVVEDCRVDGYVKTIVGRRRYLPNINSNNGQQRASTERQSINTCIQGSAADLVKMAMLKIQKKLNKMFPACNKTHQTSDGPTQTGAYFVLQLHDELLYEVSLKCLRAVARLVKGNMENVAPPGLMLQVNLKAGPRWGQLSDFKL